MSQYISRRFEGIALQYFHRMAVSGEMKDIEDYGSYWYDDPTTKTNGEFDCVVKLSGVRYDFYECKFLNKKMTLEQCRREEEQLTKIRGIQVSGLGFISINGFAFKNTGRYKLVDGKMLYSVGDGRNESCS